jgi:hypothetical protein
VIVERAKPIAHDQAVLAFDLPAPTENCFEFMSKRREWGCINFERLLLTLNVLAADACAPAQNLNHISLRRQGTMKGVLEMTSSRVPGTRPGRCGLYGSNCSMLCVM